MKTGLAGRVALVTGANHGIGAAIARALAGEGVDVFVHFFRPPLSEADLAIGGGQYARDRAQNAEAVLADCRALGVRAAALEADLSDVSSIAPLFDACEAVLDPVEILIHNAATWQADTFAPPDGRALRSWPPPDLMGFVQAETIDHNFSVNSRAAALLIAEYARRHILRGANWGRVITLTTGGASGFPGEVSYGASKAALESYSQAAAHELGPVGITVNIVSPGPTQTGWVEPDLAAGFAQQTALRRVGQPEDVAAVVLLLASNQAGWITGQRIAADGGFRS